MNSVSQWFRYNRQFRSKLLKKIIGKLLVITAVISVPAISYGNGLRLSQIDPSRLLLDQEVKVYVSVTDEDGKPVKNLTKERFKLFESANGKDFIPVPHILQFKSLVNYESGVQFFLLIDNSGSMYKMMRDHEGRLTTRIESARNAIKSFLKSANNPNDRIGLASYNSNFTLHSDVTSDKTGIYDLLEK